MLVRPDHAPRAAAAVSRPKPPADPAASRLVLFVGAALRPEGAIAAELARDGVRTLWRASTEQAVRTAQYAAFDAVCMDATTLGAGTAGVVRRLRQALVCPLLVVGSGVDPREEIDALEQGADLFLARPLPARRLCAHLIALLRRGAGAMPALTAMPAPAPTPRVTEPTPTPTLLIERLIGAIGSGHAVAEVHGNVSVRSRGPAEGLEVTISALQLRLR